MDQMDKTIVTLSDGLNIRVEPTNLYLRRRCFFCGGQTNKDGVVAEVYQDGTRTGFVVCPDYPAKRGCISQPPDVLVNHLRQQAADLQQQVDFLRAVAAAGIPDLSSIAEAYRAVEAMREASEKGER